MFFEKIDLHSLFEKSENHGNASEQNFIETSIIDTPLFLMCTSDFKFILNIIMLFLLCLFMNRYFESKHVRSWIIRKSGIKVCNSARIIHQWGHDVNYSIAR